MGQGQSAPAPLANATPLRSGFADVPPRLSRDRGCGGTRAAPLHRWTKFAAPHASIEAAPVDQSSTSERLAEAAPVDQGSTSERSREAAAVDQSSTSERSVEVAAVDQSSTSERSVEAAAVDQRSTSERLAEAAAVDQRSTSERSREAAPVDQCNTAERSTRAAPVDQSSTSERSIGAALVDQRSISERSREAAAVDQSSTSERLAEAAAVDQRSISERSREAAAVDQSSTSERLAEAAAVDQRSTSERSIGAAPVDQCSTAERSTRAAPVDQSSTSERDGNLLSSKHSIFLSHSGAQKSFVEQLCLDVERHDRYPFFDKRRNSLPIGEDFPKLIFEAIDQCQVGVVVLSEEFFSRSKWPMLELAALVKREARDPMFTIMPVFLGVTHGQCRDKANQERWLRIWEGWARADSRIKVKEWQDALRVFGWTNGISLNDKLDEVKCRQEIVEAVCKRVCSNTRWDDSHVQGRSRLSSVIGDKIGRVEVCKSYGVRILGIWGMGGIGKTTTCRVLCNEYFEEFEGRVCHVEFGVGDMLQMVQELLRRLTDTISDVIGRFSIGECKDRLKHELKKKVLLAIDNVWDSQEVVDNAKELLRLGFSEGSIIIVTARSLPQLQNLNLEDCMRMPELVEEEARSLFLYHAVPNMYLKSVGKMNEQVVKKCLERCYFRKGNGMDYHYHPLALKVLGGQLGNKVDEWMAKLEFCGGDPFNQYGEEEKDHPIFSILGRSFEILNDEDKLLFMDVAISTRYINWKKYVNVFDWLRLVHGRSLQEIMRRLEGLKSKSLLEDLGDGRERIALHDLWLEYVGMKSKGKKSDHQPWIYENVYEVNDPRRRESDLCGGGWKSLQRIWIVNGGSWHRLATMMELDLSRCSNLRVLLLEGVKIETQVLDLRVLTQLKSLKVECVGIDTDTVEVHFVGLGSLRNLAHLGLSYFVTDLTVLLDDIARLTNLRNFHSVGLSCKMKSEWFTLSHEESTMRQQGRAEGWILGHSKGDGIGAIVNMKGGEIGNVVKVVGPPLAEEMGYATCMDFAQGKQLVLMESPSSGNVQVVPVVLRSLDLSRLNSLQDLNFNFCHDLDMISGLNSKMTHLKHLRLKCCSSLRSCHGVGDLVALEELDMGDCEMLQEMPHLGRLQNLCVLNVEGCRCIEAVPGLGDLVSLKEFNAGGCGKLFELPKNMCKLVNLQILNLQFCERIEAMPGLSDLIGLEELDADFGGLGGCRDLHKLKKLKRITINGWGAKGIPCLVDLHSLKSIEIVCANAVNGLSGVSNLRRLQELRIWNCAFTDVSCLSELMELRSLDIEVCNKLQRLPNMHKLSRLELLEISWCKSLREWDSGSGSRQFGGDLCIVGALLCLRTLSLRSNVALTELPDLSLFPQLKSLDISNSERLTRLTSCAPLTALEVLTLERCGVVRALRSQVDLSNVVSPRSFKLWHCGVLQLMVHEIERLQVMCPLSRHCLQPGCKV